MNHHPHRRRRSRWARRVWFALALVAAIAVGYCLVWWLSFASGRLFDNL